MAAGGQANSRTGGGIKPAFLRPPLSLPQSRIHQEVKKSILASGLIDSGRGRDVNMVAEMVAYGDSGAFLDRVSVCRAGCAQLFT